MIVGNLMMIEAGDPVRSGIPNRAERRYPALLEAVHHLPGDGAVGDADDSLGTRLRLIGQLQHIGLAERIGVPNHRIGVGGFDFVDERLAVRHARVLRHPDQLSRNECVQ